MKKKLNLIIPKNIRVREDLTNFKIYVGDIPENERPIGFDFGDVKDESDLLGGEYTESKFNGLEEESMLEEQDYSSSLVREETVKQAVLINKQEYEFGPHNLDLIPGEFFGNNKMLIKCCQINSKPVSVKIAQPLLDMINAAKKDGVNLYVNSGFRPDYYPNINTKSQSGVLVKSQSQEELYLQNCKSGSCSPATARAGNSKHGSGIAIDLNTGSRGGAIKKVLDRTVYEWLILNSWRFGFVRTVASEEWHFEYWPMSKTIGPYAKLSKNNKLFYEDLNLNNIQIA